jgi:hypothetical protein
LNEVSPRTKFDQNRRLERETSILETGLLKIPSQKPADILHQRNSARDLRDGSASRLTGRGIVGRRKHFLQKLKEHAMIDTAARLLNPLGWNSGAISKSYLINITGLIDVSIEATNFAQKEEKYSNLQKMRSRGQEDYHVKYHCTLYSIGER